MYVAGSRCRDLLTSPAISSRCPGGQRSEPRSGRVCARTTAGHSSADPDRRAPPLRPECRPRARPATRPEHSCPRSAPRPGSGATYTIRSSAPGRGGARPGSTPFGVASEVVVMIDGLNGATTQLPERQLTEAKPAYRRPTGYRHRLNGTHAFCPKRKWNPGDSRLSRTRRHGRAQSSRVGPRALSQLVADLSQQLLARCDVRLGLDS